MKTPEKLTAKTITYAAIERARIATHHANEGMRQLFQDIAWGEILPAAAARRHNAIMKTLTDKLARITKP